MHRTLNLNILEPQTKNLGPKGPKKAPGAGHGRPGHGALRGASSGGHVVLLSVEPREAVARQRGLLSSRFCVGRQTFGQKNGWIFGCENSSALNEDNNVHC